MQIIKKCKRFMNYFDLEGENIEVEKSDDILKEFSIS
jgi:hypothetical protein